MDLSEIISVSGIFLNIAGTVFYLFYMLRGQIVSTSAGWFLSFVIASEGAYAHFNETGSYYLSGSYIAGALCCFLIFLVALRGGGIMPSRKDCYTGGFALAVLVAGFVSNDYMILSLCVYYIATYSIYISAMTGGRTQERILPWLIWLLTALCQVTALYLSKSDIIALILPVTNVFCWGTVCVLLLLSYTGKNKFQDVKSAST